MSPEIVVALLREAAELIDRGELPRDVHAQAIREATIVLALEYGG